MALYGLVVLAKQSVLRNQCGSEKICSNGQAEGFEAECNATSEVWYSAWGYREEGKPCV